ncbi:hypothetical protein [Lentzea albidocapillata]|uniref:hypothetical protein n=1 Tax=Lentzea albidocapillata TaxID=40571 RepID=UPI00210CEA64|nr:hypothetical protein [Lentzea albidocapillata]
MAGRELTHLTEFTFRPDRTKLVAIEACLRAGLDPEGMVLLRHQTNAVYQLTTAPVVVKVVQSRHQTHRSRRQAGAMAG